jgi:hypothetical protein
LTPAVGLSRSPVTPQRREPMIIEMRTYLLQPGTVAAFEERFASA